jgi:hypothetical protein
VDILDRFAMRGQLAEGDLAKERADRYMMPTEE